MGGEVQLDPLKRRESPQMSALRAILEAVAFSSSEYMLIALDALASDKNLQSEGIRNVMPYLYAAGFLSYAGKEITADNMEKVLGAIGIPSSKELEAALLSTGVKSHLPYVYAYYFILVNGILVTADKMMRVVEAMGLKPDRQRAEEMLKFCSGHVVKK